MLYLQEAGDKENPALLFLHGGGLSSKQWQPQFERLSGAFYCLAPDLPEQGQSAAVGRFTLEDSVRHVTEILGEKVPGQKAHIIGLSLGGALTLALLRAAPQMVDHALVTGTSAGLGAFLGWLTINSTWMYKLFPQNMLLDMAVRQFGVPAQYREEFRQDLINGMKAEFTQHFTRALMQLQLPEAGKLLVCVGAKETLVAQHDARKLARTIRGARGVRVPDVGHVWNLEAPELFSITVRAWVSDKPLPAVLQPLV
ncbi:MAG: alpha/beta hydrolase [Chloroflexi bacterium]|nr:alpha/beta hydrolase [Chloroflexota bacterium]